MKQAYLLFPLLLFTFFGVKGMLGIVHSPETVGPDERQHAPVTPVELEKLSRKVTEAKKLVEEAELVILGTPAGPPQQRLTGQKMANGQLVIYFQPFKVEKVLKGTPMERFRLVRPGIVPLPPVEDPLNRRFPGPLADQVRYVLFLKHWQEDQYYVLGIWQGVYPLGPDGKTIALLDEGFATFHDLTVEELALKIKILRERSRD